MPLPDLGAQDPDRRNSPIVDPIASEEPAPEIDESVPAACYFNDEEFPHGSYVKSGSQVLRCEHGVWVPAGLDLPIPP